MIELKPEGKHLYDYLYRCPCGLRYALQTKHIYLIDQDDNRAPYMSLSFGGRWKRVSEVDESEADQVVRRNDAEA